MRKGRVYLAIASALFATIAAGSTLSAVTEIALPDNGMLCNQQMCTGGNGGGGGGGQGYCYYEANTNCSVVGAGACAFRTC